MPSQSFSPSSVPRAMASMLERYSKLGAGSASVVFTARDHDAADQDGAGQGQERRHENMPKRAGTTGSEDRRVEHEHRAGDGGEPDRATA